MKLIDTLLLLLKTIVIILSVILIIVISDSIKYKQAAKYREVYLINYKFDDVLDSLGIDKIEYYDWEETAHSLNIPIDSLTIDIFLKHLLHDDIQ